MCRCGLGGASAGLAGRQWGLLLGPVLIILGHVAWLGSCAFRAARNALNNDLGAFALGAVFFPTAVCPICTPALVILLGAAAAIASPLFGAVLRRTACNWKRGRTGCGGELARSHVFDHTLTQRTDSVGLAVAPSANDVRNAV